MRQVVHVLDGPQLATVFSEWKFAEGLAELRRAKELSPANPTANDLLGRGPFYLGQIEEAEKLARQAIELDPLVYLARHNFAQILLFQGKLDEADAEARKAAELQPTAADSHGLQVEVALVRGDGEAALREARLEPTKATDVSNSRSHNTCAEIVRQQTLRWPTSSPMAEMSSLIKSLRFTLCAAKQTRHSSGYKSP